MTQEDPQPDAKPKRRGRKPREIELTVELTTYSGKPTPGWIRLWNRLLAPEPEGELGMEAALPLEEAHDLPPPEPSPLVVGSLGKLRELAALTDDEIGDVIGLSATGVARLARGELRPRPQVRDRMVELVAVVTVLAESLKPEGSHDWLLNPNRLLAHERPLDLIAHGKFRDVLHLAGALADGAFV